MTVTLGDATTFVRCGKKIYLSCRHNCNRGMKPQKKYTLGHGQGRVDLLRGIMLEISEGDLINAGFSIRDDCPRY